MSKDSNISRAPITLLGVRVDDLSLQQLLDAILENCQMTGRQSIVANVNVHAMNLSYELPWFRQFLNQSEIVFCDGFGVKIAARLIGRNIRERITYADFMFPLCEMASDHNLRMFFLGARPGIAEKAAKSMQGQYPSLVIETHHGFFDKTIHNPQNKLVIAKINAFMPDILVIAFGMPIQEQWIIENRNLLHVNAIFNGGAVFDYLSGELTRAPHWMTDHGLEWLGRLFIEPRRLWRRYIIGNPLFFLRVFWHEILNWPLPE